MSWEPLAALVVQTTLMASSRYAGIYPKGITKWLISPELGKNISGARHPWNWSAKPLTLLAPGTRFSSYASFPQKVTAHSQQALYSQPRASLFIRLWSKTTAQVLGRHFSAIPNYFCIPFYQQKVRISHFRSSKLFTHNASNVKVSRQKTNRNYNESGCQRPALQGKDSLCLQSLWLLLHHSLRTVFPTGKDSILIQIQLRTSAETPTRR